MAITILPASLEDLEACTRIELAAMLATSAHTRQQHPAGITDALVASRTARKVKTFGLPQVRYLKGVVVGSGLGGGDGAAEEEEQMVGFLRYYVWADDESARKQPPYESASTHPAGGGEQRDESGSDSGIVDLAAKKKEADEEDEASVLKRIDAKQSAVHYELRGRHVAGKKAVYISCLMVSPRHHSKGYGKRLIQPALDLARELGLPVYLMAQGAVGFYQSLGFTVVETGVADMAEFEGWSDGAGGEVVGEYRPSLMYLDVNNA
ncbi:acyl-CoA N-acyltransferase [Microdochium bolleyi]|uniref:Acyl-CoA N-acyltransferase n=1 Tax=Microdochium bolleyi TaxID=196109 RepID=A0A136ITU4_9PEZI|nr:acyl-CoA N-acyltransferase [Microdochium bolleyi]